MLGQPLDRAVLARAVAPFENDENAHAIGDELALQLDKFDLQGAKRALVIEIVVVIVVVVFRHACDPREPIIASHHTSSANGAAKRRKADRRRNRLMASDCRMAGRSGSPIYDAHERPVGMPIAAGQGTASGISYARSAFAIDRFLSAHPLNGKQ
jgi:hypothetical protein